MAKYEVQHPNGQTFMVDAPDDLPYEKVISQVRTQWSKDSRKPIPQAKPEEIGAADSFFTGAGKTFVDMYRGGKQLLGLMSPEEYAQADRIDQNMPTGKMGKAGQFAANAAMVAPTFFIPGVNTYTGAGAAGGILGLLQPTADENIVAGKAKNVALGVAGGVGGQALGQAAGKMANSSVRAAVESQMKNAQRDAIAAAGRVAGYTIPPSQTNPSTLNRWLEGVSGKIQTAQHAAQRNQDVTQKLAAQELGVPNVFPKQVEQVIKDKGAVYEALKAQPDVSMDADFFKALAGIEQKYGGVNAVTDGLVNPDVLQLVKTTGKNPSVSAKDLVEAVKTLRFHADKNLGSQDPAKITLGGAQKTAANALDDLIERNLQARGNGALMDEFRAARQLIAKAKNIQAAQNPYTGDINAVKLSKQNEPFTGNLKTIADMGGAFPKAMQDVSTQSVLPTSPLDVMGASAIGAAGGAGGAGALLGVRPLARALLLSGPYQKTMGVPSYNATLPLVAGKAGEVLLPGMVPAFSLTLPQLTK